MAKQTNQIGDSVFLLEAYTAPVYLNTLSSRISIPNNIKFDRHENGGCISKEKRFLQSKQMTKLKSSLMLELDNFFHEILGYSRESKMQITNSWVKRHITGEFNVPQYTNFNSFISGMFFISAPKNSGNLVFMIDNIKNSVFPALLSPGVVKNTKYNFNRIVLEPKQNMLVLFPSTFQFCIERNQSDENLDILCFNCLPKGKLGINETSEIEL